MMKHFKYDHLPEVLQRVSEPFCLLAETCNKKLPECEQKRITLQKLLEAKDAAVRAALEALE